MEESGTTKETSHQCLHLVPERERERERERGGGGGGGEKCKLTRCANQLLDKPPRALCLWL